MASTGIQDARGEEPKRSDFYEVLNLRRRDRQRISCTDSGIKIHACCAIPSRSDAK